MGVWVRKGKNFVHLYYGNCPPRVVGWVGGYNSLISPLIFTRRLESFGIKGPDKKTLLCLDLEEKFKKYPNIKVQMVPFDAGRSDNFKGDFLLNVTDSGFVQNYVDICIFGLF